ncbi:MAG: DUF523 domain-containing protein [Pseudomonadales bacterium]|nr:DUF523 domain-containing protein [Pseudomonadales bacterium]
MTNDNGIRDMDKASNSEDISKPLVAISSCLMGFKVRYDGKDKFNHFIAEQIAPFVSLLPICPEAAIGLGIPRPPIQLINKGNHIHAVGRDDKSLDPTAKLNHFAATICKVHSNLCGYILQSRSPSCGYNTTPIYSEHQSASFAIGSGLVAAEIQRKLPQLPLINDCDLINTQDAEAFLEKVNARFRWLHSK